MNRTIRVISLAAIASLMLVGCGSSDSDSSGGTGLDSHPYDAPPISEADKSAYLNAINNARASARNCGSKHFEATSPLVWNDPRYRAAYEHNEDMVNSGGTISHTGSGTASDWTAQILELGRGSRPHERVENNGARSPNNGEVAAKGPNSINAVVALWLGSPAHCEAIMTPYGINLGVARLGVYWTGNVGS